MPKGEHYEALVLEKEDDENYYLKSVNLKVLISNAEFCGVELSSELKNKPFLLKGALGKPTKRLRPYLFLSSKTFFMASK